jgi:hypothetical protein
MGKNPDKFFKKQLFSGSHDNSIKFVAERFVDAAGVDSLIWEYYNKVNPEFTSLTRILVKSEEFGMPPVVVQKDVDRDFQLRLFINNKPIPLKPFLQNFLCDIILSLVFNLNDIENPKKIELKLKNKKREMFL